MAHFKDTIHIDAPVAKVDAVVRDPHQWPDFWVGMEDPEKISGDGGPGTSVEYGLVMFGVHVHETGRVIEERHDPDGSTHWRWEFEGGTSGWLACDHTPEDGGTRITSEMDYTLPGSVLGKVADRLLVEKRERRDLHTTMENLKLLVEES